MNDLHLLLINANIATISNGHLHNSYILINKGKIIDIGSMNDLNAPKDKNINTIDIDGKWITPGLIDCHTHIVYAGNRSNEFNARILGASYQEIAQEGGGIKSSVKSVREASFESLLEVSLKRVKNMIDSGITTIEIKSGYGLELESEAKMLRVARKIGELLPVDVKTTFLAMHALPSEWEGDRMGYVRHVTSTMLPTLVDEGLVDAVDAFLEGIAFSYEECELLFKEAKKYNLPLKLHAEQLSNLNGAALVAEYGGLSADHLEYLSLENVKKMAKAGTIATLLPGAFYFLRESQMPPVEALRMHDVPIALATDCNPGTSPLLSPLLTMNMGCVLYRLSPSEALRGFTKNAALALGLKDRGEVSIGMRADLAIYDIDDPVDLSYMMGINPCVGVIYNGSFREVH